MATLIMVLGDEGTGKTTGFENLPPEQTLILKANNKPLPWRGHKKQFNSGKGNIATNRELGSIEPTITLVSESMPKIKYLVIDDFFHLLSNVVFSKEFLSRTSGNEAFQRYTELAAAVYAALFEKEEEWREDLYIIITNHTQIEDSGLEVFKSPGKLMEKDIKPASFVTYLLHSCVIPDEKGVYHYKYQTNRTASRLAKTPKELFSDLYIPNDMFAVIKAIEAYDNYEG